MSIVSDYTALLSGYSWSGGVAGQPATITYSFSNAATDSLQASSPAAAATFVALTDAERATVRAALAQWAAVSGITFREVTRTVGELTFGGYGMATLGNSDDAGLGNYPSTSTYLDAAGQPHIYSGYAAAGGDVYFDTSYARAATLPADFAHLALHEIGHALGLKHPFDTSGNTLAPALDDGTSTVMAYAGARLSTLGVLDVQAIQAMYGAPGAVSGVTTSWNAATESVTLTGTAGADVLVGTGGADVIDGGGGHDAISAGPGDDVIYARGAAVEVNGGPGDDLVVTGLTWTPASKLVAAGTGWALLIPGTSTFQVYDGVERLLFTNGSYSFATGAFTPGVFTPGQPATAAAGAAALAFYDGTTKTSTTLAPDTASAGGPDYLQWQYIYAGSDDMAVSTATPNMFIHTGSGSDAIQVTSGRNVLDGGLGSNFLTGGSGNDTFFTDARAPGVVWNTIVNFHAGDGATLWGFDPASSKYWWDAEPAGAAGATGATLRASIANHASGGIDASITFAGLSVAQAKQLQISTGTQPAGQYLYFSNPGV